MPTTVLIQRSDGRARPWRSAGILLVCAAVLWPALAGGAHVGWPLAATQLLILAALFLWLLSMAGSGRFEWRRTALDLPLALFIALILLQLAVGNGPLRQWALAPADGAVVLPARFLALGTVSPSQTVRSLLLFLSYVGVYVLVVNLLRRREELDRFVRVLLLVGAVLAFLSIVDFLLRESWLFHWRPGPFGSRLTGPFVNPDHWAAWMVMLICLGLGHLAGRGRPRRRPGAHGGSTSARRREDRLRQYVPIFGLMLMALATVLTLSRGALLSVLAAVVILLIGLARVRSRRWVLGLSAVLGAMTLAFALWIGVEPLLARLAHSEHVGRLEQWRSSLPMIRSFPALGVGLGAYKDIYFHFQPSPLLPGRVYFPYAHSDLLQLVIETGVVGAALALWTAVRVVRDLVGAHLLGRGRCPVAAHVQVRRSDPFSVGIMLGSLGAVAAICAHSAVDFSARIPADGVLAAACLGIATVAAHTRFGETGDQSLARTRELVIDPRRRPRLLAGVAIALLAVVLVPLIIASQARGIVPPTAEPERRLAAARNTWAALSSPGDARASEVRALAASAVDSLRRSIASTPSDPYLHERLAWAFDLEASVEPARAEELRRAAFAHMQRAVTLQPENPLLRRSLSALALSQTPPRLTLAIEAAHAAAERDPALLGSLVDQLGPLALTDAQWMALAPSDPIGRADLARQLEARGFLREAAALYEPAAADASASDEPVIRWLLARLLLRLRQPDKALEQIDDALADMPDNPELLLTRARALAALNSPVEALDAYRAAVTSAEARRGNVFPAESLRLRAAVVAELGEESRLSTARYRRALAQRLTDERRWPAALEQWERARAGAPLDAQSEFSLGLALEATGERKQALDAFRQAVTLAPTHTAFRARLAARLWEDERYVQAIAEWQAVASQEPRNVDVALALGRAYLKTGDRPRALAEYQRALTLSPGLTEAKQAVSRLQAMP